MVGTDNLLLVLPLSMLQSQKHSDIQVLSLFSVCECVCVWGGGGGGEESLGERPS